MDYFLLTFGSLLLSVDFALNKLYQRIYGTRPKAAFLFNALSGGFIALIFFAVNGFKLEITPYSSAMAALAGTLVMAYNIIGFRLLKHGTMAVYTLFLMAGGMTLPYIWGLIFLDEDFSFLRMIGLIAIIGGVLLSNSSSEKLNKKQILMCCAVFVINGFVSITLKMHQVNTELEAVNTTEFVVLQGLFKLLLAGAMYLFFRYKEKDTKNSEASKTPYKAIVIALFSATLSGMFSLMQLTVAESLPASVLYPFNTGLTIIMSSVTGVLVFKEKLSVKLVLSIALCFVGTLMFI